MVRMLTVNMKRLLPLLVLQVFLMAGLGITSCKHDPVLSDDDMMPTDPADPEAPCDPDVVYFDRQVLPILKSNCALSGCHDSQTAEEGIVLDSYESLMAADIVDTRGPSESKLYEVLVETEGDDRMPPPPANRLDQELIDRIAKWIRQGAKDLECDDTGSCETEEVSFSQTVQPILQTHCVSCHGGDFPSGGIRLNTHAGVKSAADSGKLTGALTWAAGFVPMPDGGDKLPACDIDQIVAWVDSGAPNN